MVNKVTNAEEMTGLNETVHKSKEKLQEGKANDGVKKGFKLSDGQKAAIVLGTVLLGGSAFVAVDQADGKPVEPVVPTTPSNTVSADSTSVKPPVSVGETQQVHGGTICPTDEIAIAHNANDSMTFEQAFASSRGEVGPGGVFSWHGNTYSTFFKEEWNGLSLDEKQDFLHDVGFEVAKIDPPIIPNPVDPVNPVIIVINPTTPEPPFEPIVKETMIDGKVAYAIDSDGDGFVDALVSVDEATGMPVALLDEFGDNSLDTMAMLDPTTLEPIMTAPMEETFEIAMDDVDTINEEMDLLYSDGGNGIPESAPTTETVNVSEGEDEVEENSDDDLSMNDDYHGDDNVDDLV